MKKVICIITLLYYSLGSIILPSSDLSIIPQLPELYAHCKATEDKDMNIVDFITDHLLNIDCVFDDHDNGDEQKPHKPLNTKINNCVVLIMLNTTYEFMPQKGVPIENVLLTNTDYSYDHVGNIFRPPIA